MSNPLSRRRAGARNGARLAERAIDEELARQEAEAAAKHREGVERRKAAREAEKARKKYTAAELEGAAIVKAGGRWHRVVRVNRLSVTVATAYSWDERLPIGTVTDAKWIDS